MARRKAEDARQEELAAQQKKAEEANWKRYQTAQSMQQSQRQLMVRRFQLELFGGDQEAAEEFVTLLKDIGDEMDALQEDNIPDNEPATQEEWIKFVWVDRLLPRAAQSSNATLAKWAKDLQAKIAAHTGSAPELPSWLKHKGLQGTGTGFFVTENLLATNFHVVEHGTHFELHHPDGRTEPAEVVKVDKVADLAILRASGKNPTWLSVSAGEKDPGLGHPVFTIGFPKVQLQGVEPKYTDGKISALSGMRDDKTRFQISVPIQPGNSGGPLVDESSGWVLGVVVATLTDSQNVNYAVKGRLLYQMLTGIPEFGQFKKTMPALPPGNTTAITGRVKDSIVIIMSIDQANP